MLVKEAPGVRFNIKTPSFQYRDSHYKKWERLIFIMEIPIPGKTVFTRGPGGYYWILPKLVLSHDKWYAITCTRLVLKRLPSSSDWLLLRHRTWIFLSQHQVQVHPVLVCPQYPNNIVFNSTDKYKKCNRYKPCHCMPSGVTRHSSAFAKNNDNDNDNERIFIVKIVQSES